MTTSKWPHSHYGRFCRSVCSKRSTHVKLLRMYLYAKTNKCTVWEQIVLECTPYRKYGRRVLLTKNVWSCISVELDSHQAPSWHRFQRTLNKTGKRTHLAHLASGLGWGWDILVVYWLPMTIETLLLGHLYRSQVNVSFHNATRCKGSCNA